MKKVYEFAAIPVLISSKMFLGFQYKVLHLLTEIKDGMENIGNLLKTESTSFQLTTFENLEDFYKGIYLHCAAPIKRPLKFPPPLNKRTHYAKNISAPPAPPSWGEKYKFPKLNKRMDA